jgi:hypothetical protein
MFVSHPKYEVFLPEGLIDPGSKHWRLIEISLHTPWFLLTLRELTEEREISLTRTWCIAWERDLAHILDTIDTDTVCGLICIVPGRNARARQWTSREIREVWLVRTEDAEERVRFLDLDGREFDAGLRSDPSSNVVDRRQLLKIGAP